MNPLMRLGKRKSTGTYFVEYDDRQRKSLKTRNKDEATRLYNAEKKAVRDGKVKSILGECDKSLKDLKEEFEKLIKPVQPKDTYRANMLALSKLVSVAGESTKLDKLTQRHIDQIKADHSKLSPASINNYIRHIKAVLRKAKDWKWIKVNPFAEVQEIKFKRKHPSFLDSKQALKFVNGIEDIDLRRMVYAYLITGRRRSELLNLKWEDVRFDLGLYEVVIKGGEKKAFEIGPMFEAILKAIKGNTERIGRVFTKWEHPDTISHLVKELLVVAGYPDLHLHSLRHSFASMKAMEGCTLKEIQDLLGHSSITATQIYSHLTRAHIGRISEANLGGPVDLGD